MHEPCEYDRQQNEDTGEAANDYLITHGPPGSEKRFEWEYGDVEVLARWKLARFRA